MTIQTTLTWLDAFKLFVPIAGSLIISLLMLWAKAKYSNWQEKKSKHEFLWRVIKQDSPNVVEALKALAQIGDLANEGKVKIRAFDLPKPPTDFARDLAELDPKNSYVYADYISYTDICRSGFILLTHLTKEFACLSDSHNSDRIKEVIAQQVGVLRKDLINLAESEVVVIKTIAAGSRKYDKQDVANIEDNLKEAKKEKERWNPKLSSNINTETPSAPS